MKYCYAITESYDVSHRSLPEVRVIAVFNDINQADEFCQEMQNRPRKFQTYDFGWVAAHYNVEKIPSCPDVKSFRGKHWRNERASRSKKPGKSHAV
jgi:hypothetical protein